MASLSDDNSLDSLVGTLMQQLRDDPPEWLQESSTSSTIDESTKAAIDVIANSSTAAQEQKIKFIIAPGNGGCGKNIKKANWYNWFHEEMLKRGHESICVNFPDPFICHQTTWIPFCIQELKCDENTIIVGHSTGALMAMRLAETHKVRGIILVSAAHTDLGDAGERASGYFDTEWDWNAQKNNTGFIHQFHSKDDPLIPVEEARFVAEQLQGKNHTYDELDGYSHFFEPFQPLLAAIDSYVPPVTTSCQ
jgi:predicted alpha/beta hydrolase family esterase